MGGSSLLLLAMLNEGVKLLPHRIHIAYARVGSQGTEPSSHWQLHIGTLPLEAAPYAWVRWMALIAGDLCSEEGWRTWVHHICLASDTAASASLNGDPEERPFANASDAQQVMASSFDKTKIILNGQADALAI